MLNCVGLKLGSLCVMLVPKKTVFLFLPCFKYVEMFCFCSVVQFLFPYFNKSNERSTISKGIATG